MEESKNRSYQFSLRKGKPQSKESMKIVKKRSLSDEDSVSRESKSS